MFARRGGDRMIQSWEGCQKSPKICPIGLCMTPMYLYTCMRSLHILKKVPKYKWFSCKFNRLMWQHVFNQNMCHTFQVFLSTFVQQEIKFQFFRQKIRNVVTQMACFRFAIKFRCMFYISIVVGIIITLVSNLVRSPIM